MYFELKKRSEITKLLRLLWKFARSLNYGIYDKYDSNKFFGGRGFFFIFFPYTLFVTPWVFQDFLLKPKGGRINVCVRGPHFFQPTNQSYSHIDTNLILIPLIPKKIARKNADFHAFLTSKTAFFRPLRGGFFRSSIVEWYRRLQNRNAHLQWDLNLKFVKLKKCKRLVIWKIIIAINNSNASIQILMIL